MEREMGDPDDLPVNLGNDSGNALLGIENAMPSEIRNFRVHGAFSA